VSSFPTRESSQPTANGARPGSKKKKAGEDEDTDSASKRHKISYARDGRE
jgi:chromatin modification-related protein EAF6